MNWSFSKMLGLTGTCAECGAKVMKVRSEYKCKSCGYKEIDEDDNKKQIVALIEKYEKRNHEIMAIPKGLTTQKDFVQLETLINVRTDLENLLNDW